MVRDYTEVDIREDVNAFNYTRKERIADLTNRLLGYGLSPDFVNKKSLGKRYNTSHTTIYRDLQVIAKSIEEYKNLDNLDVDETFEAWIEGHDLDLEAYSERNKPEQNYPDGYGSYDELPENMKKHFKKPNDTNKTNKRQNKQREKPSYEEQVKGSNSSSDKNDSRPSKPRDVPSLNNSKTTSNKNDSRPSKPRDVPSMDNGDSSSKSKDSRPNKPEDVPNFEEKMSGGTSSSETDKQSDDIIPYDQHPQEVKDARPRETWKKADEETKKYISEQIREKRAKGEYD